MHPLDLVLHYTSLASAGLLWIKDLGGDHSQNSRGDPLLGAWQERLCGPAQCRLGHLAQGPSPDVCLPFLFPHLIFSSGLFLFCYLFSLHEMYLEEPSSAEPLSSYCLTVGKTSLITRFMYDSFDNTYQVRSWVPLPSLVSAAMTVAWSPPWPLSRAC